MDRRLSALYLVCAQYLVLERRLKRWHPDLTMNIRVPNHNPVCSVEKENTEHELHKGAELVLYL